MHAVTDESFEADVLRASLPVLVDFWAPWCGPCRTIAPFLEELDGRLKIVKLNVDDHQSVAGALGIRSIPTLLVFKDGKAVEGAVGALSKVELKALVLPHLDGGEASDAERPSTLASTQPGA